MTEKASTNRELALADATRLALEALRGVDLGERCRLHGLPQSDEGGVDIPFLGRVMRFSFADASLRSLASGRAAHPVDRLILLRLLAQDSAARLSGKSVSFRHFPGGQFYWQPFRSRTVAPLVKAIANDSGLLRERLALFDIEAMQGGDLAASIHVLGPIRLGLVYHLGDGELPPDADILFDSGLARVWDAEDAAAIAGRICMRLAARPCASCGGCGFCGE